MVPNTLLGVLAFLASAGPGYAYVKIAERWRPPVERTALREAAELVVIGSLATTIGIVIALVVGDVARFLDTVLLAERPGRYLVTEPLRAGAALLIILGVSYGGAALAAFLIHKGRRPIYPDSAWWGAFERHLPTDHGIYATVELKDGRAITGGVHSFTAEPVAVDNREITLGAPANRRLEVRRRGEEEPIPIEDHIVLLRGSDIACVSARYLPVAQKP
jgi:uncharacterized protein DUF6338